MRDRMRTGSDLSNLKNEVAALELYLMAIQRMMISRGVCTADEFAALVRQIDAEDGKLDGKCSIPDVKPIEE
jgi:hypothetical protein